MTAIHQSLPYTGDTSQRPVSLYCHISIKDVDSTAEIWPIVSYAGLPNIEARKISEHFWNFGFKFINQTTICLQLKSDIKAPKYSHQILLKSTVPHNI